MNNFSESEDVVIFVNQRDSQFICFMCRKYTTHPCAYKQENNTKYIIYHITRARIDTSSG